VCRGILTIKIRLNLQVVGNEEDKGAAYARKSTSERC
jgi:hypothetical protein